MHFISKFYLSTARCDSRGMRGWSDGIDVPMKAGPGGTRFRPIDAPSASARCLVAGKAKNQRKSPRD